MIQAFRVKGQLVLEVADSSIFEAALLASTSVHNIVLAKLPPVRAGFSRYCLSHPSEGRFSEYLAVAFRRWPRRRGESRVLVQLRKMSGSVFSCKSTERQLNLHAPYDAAAKVRCGLHAGTYDWQVASCCPE